MRSPPVQARAALLAVMLLVTACGAAHGQGWPPWWDAMWRHRKLVRLDRGQPQGIGARLWVHIRKDADSGGRDIRVIGPEGEPVGFGIMHATAEGRYLLAFQTPASSGVYAVYYDNPRAGPTNPNPPQAGLLYETRPIPKGANPSSWHAAQATLSAAGPPSGAEFWKRVFDAYNPFGPQSNYIATYRGYIRIPSAGHWSFATVSNHSSFLLVDDQLVTEWVGRHNIRQGRRGEHSGSIYLDRGIHSFHYMHFAYGAGSRGLAAWQPPDTKRWLVIPESAFPPLRGAHVYESERYDQPICADFTVAPRSYCEAGKARMVTVHFSSTSTTAAGGLLDRYQWDFGDGQVSDAPRPDHVFLAPGTYTVTLSITNTGGDRTRCTKTVKAEPIWNDLDFRRHKLEKVWQGVRNYRLEALPTPSLLAIWEFAKNIEHKEKASEAALELDDRRHDLTPVQFYDVAMDIGHYYQEVEKRPDRAEQYLRLAHQSVPESDGLRRFKARFALCDHYFYQMEEPEKARGEYEKLRADFPRTDPRGRRTALIRIGDTYRSEGNAAAALERYAEAEGDPAYQPDKPRAMVVGSGLQQTESYLRAGNADAALGKLDELLDHYPTMRLEGEPTLLRLRTHLLKGNFKGAKKEADTFIAISKDPNSLPAVHVEAAEACIELGLTEEAEAHYRTVLDDFPESPQVPDAENGLRRLGE